MNKKGHVNQSRKTFFSVINVKKDLEKIYATLTNDFESLTEKAEKLGDITYVVEANGLKRKRSENRGNKKVGRNTGMFRKKLKNT